MKTKFLPTVMLSLTLICFSFQIKAQNNAEITTDNLKSANNVVVDLKNYLNQLSANSNNEYFKNHCKSIIDVIDAKRSLTSYDSSLLQQIYTTFSDPSVASNASELSSYTERKRPFIVSWTSPTDGAVSLAWLILPENWDPTQTYPFYVRLHGLADVYSNPIEYMAYYLKPETLVNTTFEDGYSFLPWARGNYWYEGISETDVWEGINIIKTKVHIDNTKEYLTGFSMGGFGTWYIGQKSPDYWAALGVYAGALWYDQTMSSEQVIDNLLNVPVYFIVGTSDGLYSENENAYELLRDAGNPNLSFNTFDGGHESRLENWQGMYEWIRNFTNNKQENNIQNNADISSQIHLSNFPNPFNFKTNISYTLDKDGQVSIFLCNTLGQNIRTLINERVTSGEHAICWDGKDNAGSIVPGGIYICKLQSGSCYFTCKIILDKK